MNLLLLSIVMAGGAMLLTAVSRSYALKVQLLDVPNVRSAHEVPTPRGGGIAVYLAYTAGLIWLWIGGSLGTALFTALAGGGSLVALIGFWDDHRDLSRKLRLACHALAVGWVYVCLGGDHMPELAAGLPQGSLALVFALAGLSLVWFINLYNFMDGIDGIAGTEAVSVCLLAALLQWSGGHLGHGPALVALAAAAGGFLVWNWSPARVFLGDAGSGFLGFAIGTLAVATVLGGELNVWSWLILLGVFVVDATVTLLRRMLRGDQWHEAHSTHAYQHAARRWSSHSKVCLSVLCINVAWLFPLAWLAADAGPEGVYLLLLAYAPLIWLALYLRAGVPARAGSMADSTSYGS